MSYFNAFISGLGQLVHKEALSFKPGDNEPYLTVILNIPQKNKNHYILARMKGEQAEAVNKLDIKNKPWCHFRGLLSDKTDSIEGYDLTKLSIILHEINETSNAQKGIAKVEVLGRLVSKPELVSFEKGISFTKTSIAVNRLTANGETIANFFECSCFVGSLLEEFCDSYDKGNEVYLEGNLAFYNTKKGAMSSIKISSLPIKMKNE